MTKIEKALVAFFKQHPTETFYALAIDAGYLCLNSEEQFAIRQQRYSAKWEIDTAPVTLAQANKCPKRSLGNMYPSLAFNLRQSETFERALELENESRADRRAEGNSYAAGGRNWERLRYGVGDFEYSQVISLGLDKQYQSHYERNQPKTSPYAKRVRTIVAALKKNKAALLKGVKVSKGFRIYAVDHML